MEKKEDNQSFRCKRCGTTFEDKEKLKKQKEKAEYYVNELNKSGAYPSPIVTEIASIDKFYPADDYHQEYYENNKSTNPYCSVVIRPKLEKFEKVFARKLKSNN